MKWRPREVEGRVDQVQYGGSVSTVRYGARSCVSTERMGGSGCVEVDATRAGRRDLTR